MKVHDLKTWPDYFWAVARGDKPFEVRKNDRGYEPGDLLVLRLYYPDTQAYDEEDAHIVARVTYVLGLEVIGKAIVPSDNPDCDTVVMGIHIIEKRIP